MTNIEQDIEVLRYHLEQPKNYTDVDLGEYLIDEWNKTHDQYYRHHIQLLLASYSNIHAANLD